MLENQVAIEALRQPTGKARLADANRAFDNDKTGRRRRRVQFTDIHTVVFLNEFLYSRLRRRLSREVDNPL